MANEDGVRAVELFEGDNEGEFVLQGERTEGPEEIGLIEESFVVAVGTANDHGHGAGGLLPLGELRGELAAGELLSVFVEDDPKITLAAGEKFGGFAGAVGGFDAGMFDGCEFGEAGEVFVAAGFGIGEGRFADGEDEKFHDFVSLQRWPETAGTREMRKGSVGHRPPLQASEGRSCV